jgi:hypothetical protein
MAFGFLAFGFFEYFYLWVLCVSVGNKNRALNKNPDKRLLIGADPANPSKI